MVLKLLFLPATLSLLSVCKAGEPNFEFERTVAKSPIPIARSSH